jgi:hypothetical protein
VRGRAGGLGGTSSRPEMSAAAGLSYYGRRDTATPKVLSCGKPCCERGIFQA